MPSRSAPAASLMYLVDALADPRRVPETLRAHAVGIGEILEALELDPWIVGAGMAVPLVAAGGVPPESLAAKLEPEAVALIRQVSALPAFEAYSGQDGSPLTPTHAENLRKLLLAVVQDGRVILVLLAERLQELRAAKRAAPELQRRLALATREIYAPLANRLGIWQLKWELEDLAFRYLEPESYRQVAAWLKERRSSREAHLNAAAAELTETLRQAGIVADVAGRPKHIYSIWRKMQRKGLSFEEMYDLLALRVLVDDVAGCYAALGVVHGLWRHIAREFDDYIAAPKDNYYRSLHTAVMGPDAKPLEIQIRTRDMHRHAEFGVASHWRYKEGMSYDPALETRIGWMRQLLAPGGDEDFIERFRTELVEERVYVLSPKGAVFDLPRGATALDFAYYVHTDVGHRCRGARVNGRMVPISQVLDDGDQVEIQTSREGEPSRDWLNPQYGYLVTPRARDKLRAFFRQQDRGQNVSYGRDTLERELERLGLRDFRHDRLLKHFQFGSLEELFAALGAGDLSSAQLAGALQRELAESRPVLPLRPARTPRTRSQHGTPVLLPGVSGEVLVTLARCCRPVPGEAIHGYITQGHGISVHRKSCASLARLAARAPQRLTEVQWRADTSGGQPVDISLEGRDRRNLLNDIMALLADEDLRLVTLDSRADADT
ncbi:MAG: RelA/SpoT family protein, partial [Gammaproteobacteria bacterium]